MKRIFVSLSFMLAVGITTAFADNKTDVSSKVKESFKKEFMEAELVTWDEIETYQIARFVFHNHAAIAYFNEDGEFLGSAKTILFNELPLTVIKSFERKFPAADFTEISEVSNIEGTSYVVTAETKNKKYHVKVNPNGSILNSFRIK
jgi:hypothetical protein